MPPGLNATVTLLNSTAAAIRFNDTGHANWYENVGGVYRLAYTGDRHSLVADRNAYAYDTDGRLETITMANGRQVLFEYNDASYAYPAATAGEAWLEFRPSSKIDHENKLIQYTYDSVFQLPYQTITPNGVGGTPRNQYQGDAAATTCGGLRGQLCKIIDGKGNTTSITYNADRYPATITHPAPLGAVTNTFDAAGRVATSTDGKGQTATYAYDGNDRLLQTRFGATCVPATCVTYTYDANGNLKTRVDGSGTTTHNYDAQNRPTSKTIGGVTTILTYDPASNVTSFTDPTGTVD
jgi:YD repeat-containing protein